MDSNDNESSALNGLEDLADFANLDGLDGVETMDGIDGMDGMDDLFLDPGPIPPPTPPKGFSERLAELQATGCCQKIAWSKHGCIAYISRDGFSVRIKAFAPSFPNDAVTLNTAGFHGSAEIMHISWDRMGSNLVVVDVFGRLSIFKTNVCLNKMSITGRYVPDEADILSSIVGLEWTPVLQTRESKICYSASCKDDSWSYSELAEALKGPLHPIPNSHALFLVTRGGLLRLIYAMIYPEPENMYSEVNCPLEAHISFDNLITHAALSPSKDSTMLLATYDMSQTMRLYSIAIEWNYPFQQNQRPPPTFKLVPNLVVSQLQTIKGCVPNGALRTGQACRLTHLKFLPALDDTVANRTIPSEIIASFTTADLESHVCTWEVQGSREELETCFQQLSTKKQKNKESMLNTIQDLNRREDVVIPYVLISVLSTRLDTCLFFCRGDGTVECRERDSSLSLLHAGITSGDILYLQHAGFSFPQGDPYLVAALSPSGCILATRDSERPDMTEDFSLRYMDHQVDDDSLITPALVMALATTCHQPQHNDDLLEVISRTHQRKSINIEKILDDVYRFASIGKITTPQDELRKLVSPVSHRCLSTQMICDSMTDSNSNRSSNFAWLLLSLRFCLFSLPAAWDNAQKRDNFRAEVPSSVFGLIKWYLDTSMYLASELFLLASSQKFKNGDSSERQALLSQSLPVHLVLSAVGRVTLISANRYARRVDDMYKQYKDIDPPRTVQSWTTLIDLISSCPLQMVRWEEFLQEIDHHARQLYKQAELDEEACMGIERALLLSETIPAVLEPVTERLMTSALHKLVESLKDPGLVVFADTRSVWAAKGGMAARIGNHFNRAGTENKDGMSNNSGAKDSSVQRSAKMDVVRKVPLTGNKPLRRCIRCGCETEDLENRQITTGWLFQFQKQCCCGNVWVVADSTAA